MDSTVEIVVIDRETHHRVVVASFQKSIGLPDCFPEDVAGELFRFLSKKTGKLIGEPKENLRDMSFFPQPLNDGPFEKI